MRSKRHGSLGLAVLMGVPMGVFTACQPQMMVQKKTADIENSMPTGTEVPPDAGVVKARAQLHLLLGADGSGKGEVLSAELDSWEPVTSSIPEIEIFSGDSEGTDVSVTLPANTAYDLDLSKFVSSPVISNSVVQFGSIGVAGNFYDNKIKVCGPSQKGVCGSASIRAYTTQPASVASPSDGLWNAADGYGVPLSISNNSGSPQVIRLGQANSATLQSMTIPGSKRVLSFADWRTLGGSQPSYAVSADFSLAGAGVYSATLVLEYVLSP